MIHTIFLVRHGHKRILDDPAWGETAQRPYDTPLSQKGIEQAEETAQLLANEKIDVIFSSPFYRAFETASIIANRINKKVNIEWGFSEWLNPSWFKAFPELMTIEEASEVFPMVNKDYITLTEAQYPEFDENVHVYDRVKSTLMKIQERYNGSILVVGHGASVYQLARVLMDPPKGIGVEMCAVNKFVLRNSEWKLEFAGTDHLSAPDFQLNL